VPVGRTQGDHVGQHVVAEDLLGDPPGPDLDDLTAVGGDGGPQPRGVDDGMGVANLLAGGEQIGVGDRRRPVRRAAVQVRRRAGAHFIQREVDVGLPDTDLAGVRRRAGWDDGEAADDRAPLLRAAGLVEGQHVVAVQQRGHRQDAVQSQDPVPPTPGR